MTYTSKPWTLDSREPKLVREKREKLELSRIHKSTEENLPISVARVVKFLNENKDKEFTNAQIAKETGLSDSSVSQIMDKLEEINSVNIVKIRKGLKAGLSQVYQSVNGSSQRVEKEREKNGVISQILEVFENNVNRVYTKADISKILKITNSKIGNSLSILLITRKIKVVGAEKNSFIYQNTKGNRPPVAVSTEPNVSYISLSSYLKRNNCKCNKKIKDKITKEKSHLRLFHSSRGIIEEYEISYLHKVLSPCPKKKERNNLLEKIKIW